MYAWWSLGDQACLIMVSREQCTVEIVLPVLTSPAVHELCLCCNIYAPTLFSFDQWLVKYGEWKLGLVPMTAELTWELAVSSCRVLGSSTWSWLGSHPFSDDLGLSSLQWAVAWWFVLRNFFAARWLTTGSFMGGRCTWCITEWVWT